MSRTRALTGEGIARFQSWLERPDGPHPPADLLEDERFSEFFGGHAVDPERTFATRQEFGVYLNDCLASAEYHNLMSPDSDGLWAWLAVVYFAQLSRKGIRRAEHYIVTRKGSAGSLAYRQAARTSFELVHIHGPSAEICLRSPIDTLGELTEQLASRQAIAHNRGFFQVAFDMYMHDGTMRRGAASKPRKPKDRKPGDRTGFGSVRRLAIALQRLDLTYDTGDMESPRMRAVLPKEFAKWASA